MQVKWWLVVTTILQVVAGSNHCGNIPAHGPICIAISLFFYNYQLSMHLQS